MAIGCNIWMICLELNWFVYDPSWMLHLSEFVWTPCSSGLVVLNNFLLIDATDRRKISSDQKRFFIALSLYPLSFFVNTPFKCTNSTVMFTGCICGIKMLGRLYRRFRFYEKCMNLQDWVHLIIGFTQRLCLWFSLILLCSLIYVNFWTLQQLFLALVFQK